MKHFVDIHSHLLPGVDDGAQTSDVTNEMVHKYREIGFGTVVATPHVEYSTAKAQLDSLASLGSVVASRARPLGVQVLGGTELRLSPRTVDSGFDLGSAVISGTNHILVDFESGALPWYAEQCLFDIQLAGFVPILAHPERYKWSTEDRFRPSQLVQRGVLFQVTLGSLSGVFGRDAKKNAKNLLADGLVHFLATDAHSARSRLLAAEEGMATMEREYPSNALSHYLIDNPSELLVGGTIRPLVSKIALHRRGRGLIGNLLSRLH